MGEATLVPYDNLNPPLVLTVIKNCNTKIHRTLQEVSNPPGPHHGLLSA